MESVISLMREVELQEKAVEQAKEEAAEGGLELFKRVEELKETLQHAKEANDMVDTCYWRHITLLFITFFFFTI